jgi:hypothetical protein
MLPEELANAAALHSDRGALCVAVATADEDFAGLMYVTMRIGLACCMLYLQVRPGTVD